MRLVKITINVLIFCVVTSDALQFKYHSNEEIERVLHNFTKTVTKNLRTELHSLGESKKGYKLWVLMITATKPKSIGVPNVKLIGNMHGNEAAGREVLLHFIEYLKNNYANDTEVAWLLNHTKIHIMPTMNPDGFTEAISEACNGERGRKSNHVDLNRNFPDPFHNNTIQKVREYLAVKKWMEAVPFILSAAFHGGALVANYPYDSLKDTRSDGKKVESRTPDNDVFKHLAEVYSQNHLTMHLNNKQHLGDNCRDTFEGGITNGAKWYYFEGSMGDYNYFKHGCMELTLEISCCKYPKPSLLPQLWLENKKALLKWSLEANKGIAGQIIDAKTRNFVGNADLTVIGRNITFHSFRESGEFWRLLLPGKYQLKVEAKGYHTQIVPFEIKNYNNSLPKLTYKEILIYNSTLYTTTTTTTTVPTTKLKRTKPHVTPTHFSALSSRSGFGKTEFPAEVNDPTLSASVSAGNTGVVLNEVLFLYAFVQFFYL